jgi:glutamate racemase
MPIGIFDSGVGGLAILRAIRSLLPAEELIYVADSAHLPYGEKSAAEVSARAVAIAEFLLANQVKAIVAACNTATAYAIDRLRSRCSIPIIGVEPGVKPAALSTQSGVVGILATTATTESMRFADLVRRFGHGVRFIVQPCPGLAEEIEGGEFDGVELQEMLRARLAPLVDAGADTIVLGCTHYSFVTALIQRVAGPQVNIIDTSTAVARQLARILDERQLLSAAPVGPVRFYSSSDPLQFQAALRLLWDSQATSSALPPSRESA